MSASVWKMLSPFVVEFWSPKFWLPPNVTWDDLKSTEEEQYANFNDLVYSLFFAVIIMCIRFLLQRYCFAPLGIALGLKPRRTKQPPHHNSILENAFQANGAAWHQKVEGLAKQTDMSERQVQRWFRDRLKSSKPTKLDKFSETAWRFVFYLSAFVYGLWALWDKPWLWDTRECWTNFPRHEVGVDIWWYYMVELSFYWSLAISQFYDIQRKDFWMMFIHHVCTILLLSLSWTCNLVRIGTLVLVVHDFADIFLESAKMAKYASYEKTCDILFGIFFFAFPITRIIIYPFWILNSTCVEAPEIVHMFPGYYVFNGFLIMLLLMHIGWTYAVVRTAVGRLYFGTAKDVRSSSSEENDKNK